MKKIFLSGIFLFFIQFQLFCQSPSVRELSIFPEEYLGKTITLKNLWWYPVLEDFKD